MYKHDKPLSREEMLERAAIHPDSLSSARALSHLPAAEPKAEGEEKSAAQEVLSAYQRAQGREAQAHNDALGIPVVPPPPSAPRKKKPKRSAEEDKARTSAAARAAMEGIYDQYS